MFDDLGEAPLKHGHRWGDWMLDAERLCLCLVRDPQETDPCENVYEIDLEEITHPIWILDWMEQIDGKKWATVECMGHLTRALLRIFRPRDYLRPRDVFAMDPMPALRTSIDRDWQEVGQ